MYGYVVARMISGSYQYYCELGWTSHISRAYILHFKDIALRVSESLTGTVCLKIRVSIVEE